MRGKKALRRFVVHLASRLRKATTTVGCDVANGRRLVGFLGITYGAVGDGLVAKVSENVSVFRL